jgi:hypothetical protein
MKRQPAQGISDLPGQQELPAVGANSPRHLAAARLRPRVAQKPCDHGLFGDQAAQTDLVDLLAGLPNPKGPAR